MKTGLPSRLGFALSTFTLLTAGGPAHEASPAAIPYVASQRDTVRDMLWMGGVGTNDMVYDLGSGDGRVVIAAVKEFKARKAVGVEIDAKLVAESRAAAVAAGVADRVSFIEGDLFTNDFSEATVLVLYLGQPANIELRSRIFRTLQPGARVVSHQFGMGEWLPDRKNEVRRTHLGMYGERHNPFRTNTALPDFDGFSYRRDFDTVASWVVPARVAGVWRGRVRTDAGEEELKLVLEQRLSGVGGGFEFVWPTNVAGGLQAELMGDRLRLECLATNRFYSQFRMSFDGRVSGDTLRGRLSVWERDGTRELEWTGQRDKVDFTGTWEWTGPMDRPVRLKIERVDGRLEATYIDPDRATNAWNRRSPSLAVEDFYDIGGGFYFTLLLGAEQVGGGQSYTTVARVKHRTASRRMGPEDGWVIGQALAGGAGLEGTIGFYPYPDDVFSRVIRTGEKPVESKPERRAVMQRWTPRRLRQ